ncbi:MAG TPA: hypothetical protein VMH01_07320 [Puia sp.]|nr:hypothetical protein [Puia sp.]
MKLNRTLIAGIILVMFGAFLFQLTIIRHLDRKKALPKQLVGLGIAAIGGYEIFKGKKQQLRDEENEN